MQDLLVVRSNMQDGENFRGEVELPGLFVTPEDAQLTAVEVGGSADQVRETLGRGHKYPLSESGVRLLLRMAIICRGADTHGEEAV